MYLLDEQNSEQISRSKLTIFAALVLNVLMAMMSFSVLLGNLLTQKIVLEDETLQDIGNSHISFKMILTFAVIGILAGVYYNKSKDTKMRTLNYFGLTINLLVVLGSIILASLICPFIPS